MIQDLIKALEKEYPNRADVLKDKSELEVAVYIAKLELIEHIKQMTKEGSKR